MSRLKEDLQQHHIQTGDIHNDKKTNQLFTLLQLPIVKNTFTYPIIDGSLERELSHTLELNAYMEPLQLDDNILSLIKETIPAKKNTFSVYLALKTLYLGDIDIPFRPNAFTLSRFTSPKKYAQYILHEGLEGISMQRSFASWSGHHEGSEQFTHHFYKAYTQTPTWLDSNDSKTLTQMHSVSHEQFTYTLIKFEGTNHNYIFMNMQNTYESFGYGWKQQLPFLWKLSTEANIDDVSLFTQELHQRT